MILNLTEEQFAALQELGHIEHHTTPGMCRVSAVVAYKELSPRMVDIPMNSDTVSGLEFIGVTTQNAREIFVRWANRPNPEVNPVEFLEYAMHQLVQLETAAFEAHGLTEGQAIYQAAAATTDRRVHPHVHLLSLYSRLEGTLKIDYHNLLTALHRIQQAAIDAVDAKRKRSQANTATSSTSGPN